MGIILTAAVYFIFGLIVGYVLVAIAISGFVYNNYKYNDPKSTEAMRKLYEIGEQFYGKK